MVLNYLIVIFLIIISGLFSGLTLGLLGLNLFDLKRKVKLDDKQAIKIYPLREKGNLLLCTLLLGNVAVNSTLAVYLGSIVNGVVAGILATVLIVIFGEILPQALFSRYALKFGSKITWLVYLFIYLLYPVAKPLSMILDYFLGGELPTVFSKREIRMIVDEQKCHKGSDLTEGEYNIIKGGLIISGKTVESVMTPRVNTFFINQEASLDRNTLSNIQNSGHSRIPVYCDTLDKVVGLLYAKDLVTVDPSSRLPVKGIMRKKFHFIKEHSKLNKVLDEFKQKKVHIFIVLDKYKGVAGIITLEDVLEEIVGEIMDEYDKIIDMRKVSEDITDKSYK